jgi:hypothetical protein
LTCLHDSGKEGLGSDELGDWGGVAELFGPCGRGRVWSEGKFVVPKLFGEPLGDDVIDRNVGEPEVDLLDGAVLAGSVENARAVGTSEV